MQAPNLGDFLTDNKNLLKGYFDIRLRILKLRLTRLVAKTAGNFTWMLVFLFVIFLFSLFVGLTAGFYLSSVTGSYAAGFGLTALAIFLLVLLLILFRRQFFIDPIIRAVIKSLDDAKNDHPEK